ncbi:MAG: EamA family transporter [Chloroflexota bacterium]|nr:hypothetical protein [Spirochaetales bacterium]MEE3228660.1 EamA family transporter [Chloroflexota bacterium]|tara:strand:+ start:220 stop:636 length:417 start_codon:yes stop_codon:yes gene_type:complete
MNTTISLAVLSLFAFGVGSFLWQVAGANQAYAPSYMIVEGLTFAVVGLVIHVVDKHKFYLSNNMVGYGVLGGILAGIAVYALILAFSMGGAGSIMYPISRLGMVVSVILAVLIYREPVTITKLIGLGLGVSSIVVLSR